MSRGWWWVVLAVSLVWLAVSVRMLVLLLAMRREVSGRRAPWARAVEVRPRFGPGPFAWCVKISRAALREPEVVWWAEASARKRLAAHLVEVGAVPLGPVSLAVSDSSADLWTSNVVAVVAEVEGLVLRIPSPFPLVSWWPAVDRFEGWCGWVATSAVGIPRRMLAAVRRARWRLRWWWEDRA